MTFLSMHDNITEAVRKLGDGNEAALNLLVDLVRECRAIDPSVEHPFQRLVQLDRYKLTGPWLAALHREVCKGELVQLLALLRWAELGRVRPSSIRAAVTASQGRVPPPWYYRDPVDAVRILSLVRAGEPNFGAAPCQSS